MNGIPPEYWPRRRQSDPPPSRFAPFIFVMRCIGYGIMMLLMIAVAFGLLVVVGTLIWAGVLLVDEIYGGMRGIP